METLIWPTINLSILLALLTYFLRAPLREFVSSRHISIRDMVDTAREQLRQAKLKFENFSAKLDSVDAEVKDIKSQSAEEGEKLKSRVLSQAKETAGILIQDSREAAKTQITDLKSELMKEFGKKILNETEIILKKQVTGEDKAKIQKDFAISVGGSQ